MREIIALIVPLILVIVTIYFSFKNKISTSLTTVVLSFSLLSGLAIVNYDFIKKLRYGEFELETFERQVNKITDSAIEKLQSEVRKHEEELKKTSKEFDDFKLLMDFSNTVLNAHNDDAFAFDKLSDWANDKSYSYSSRAKEAMWAVFDKHGSGFWAVVPLEQYEDYHPSKIHNMKDIRQLYKKAESLIETFVKPSILQHMWNRKDITEREKVDLLIEVITGDKSLAARETAGRLIIEKLTKKGQIETHPLHKHIILKMAKEYMDYPQS